MAKEILDEKSAISLHELVSNIGWKHNFARTTIKQLDHIESIIGPWAGIVQHKSGEMEYIHQIRITNKRLVWLDKTLSRVFDTCI